MKEVDFHLGCKVTKISSDAVYYVDAQGTEKSIAAQQVLMSIGRRPNTQHLDALHLDIARTGIVVDEYLRTNVPHVYAIGDVNGKSLLAHSASRMADVVIAQLYGQRKQRMRYHAIPWAVYSHPEAAGCGLTEQAAKEQGREFVSATVQMRANGRFLAEQGKRAGGLCKVVADKQSNVILGIHLLGPYSSEIIWGAAAIIESELRIQDVKEIVFPHPSVSEVIKDALYSIEHTL
jgi:dihydrolipoamide dehydrogenase